MIHPSTLHRHSPIHVITTRQRADWQSSSIFGNRGKIKILGTHITLTYRANCRKNATSHPPHFFKLTILLECASHDRWGDTPAPDNLRAFDVVSYSRVRPKHSVASSWLVTPPAVEVISRRSCPWLTADVDAPTSSLMTPDLPQRQTNGKICHQYNVRAGNV